MVRGRVLRVTVDTSDKKFFWWIIPNQGLTRTQLQAVTKGITSDYNYVKADHHTRYLHVCGDFNFESVVGQRLDFGKEGLLAAPPTRQRPGQLQLEAALASLTEFVHGDWTHYSKTHNISTRIDRHWGSSSQYFFPQLEMGVKTWGHADAFDRTRASDHCPVEVTIMFRRPVPKQNRRIPPCVISHPVFQAYKNTLLAAENTAHLHPHEAHHIHKLWIRSISEQVMHLIMAHPETPAQRDTVLGAIARATIRNDVTCASAMCKQNSFVAEHLEVAEGRARLKGAADFARLVRGGHASSIDKELKALNLRGDSARKRRERNRLHQLSLLRAPLHTKHFLQAVRLEDGKLVMEQAKEEACHQHWKEVHAGGKCDTILSDTMLQSFGTVLVPASVSPPSRSCWQNGIPRFRESAPGPDGMPYCVWSVGGGPLVLERLSDWLMCGGAIDPTFLESKNIYLPKGEEDSDYELIVRSVDQTRPISLGNSDRKIVAAINNNPMKLALAETAFHTQLGFIAERQLVANLADWEHYCRLIGTTSSLEQEPVGFLADLRAAFPSVAHAWLRQCVVKSVEPLGLQALILAYYAAASIVDADGKFCFGIYCGVAQGCPWSGSLFALTLDAWLRMLYVVLDEGVGGKHRACADDIWAISWAMIRSIAHLGILVTFFRDLERCTNMSLNLSKCVVIPIACAWDEEVQRRIKGWLSVHLPEWSGVKVSGHSRLLGMQVGPDAGAKSWDSVLHKMRQCVNLCHSRNLPSSISIYTYNTRIATCATYIGQLLPPSPQARLKELNNIHKILKLPQSTFSFSAVCKGFNELGMPTIKSYVITSLAAAVRCMLRTIPNWPQLVESLKINEDLDMQAFCGGALGDKHFIAVGVLEYYSHIDSGTLPDRDYCRLLGLGYAVARSAGIDAKKVQKTAYQCMIKAVSGPSVVELMQERFAQYFGSSHTLDFRFVKSRHRTRGVSLCVKWSIVKSLLGGWACSERLNDMNHNCQSCIFGCLGEPDAWGHYIQCNRLWHICCEACQIPQLSWILTGRREDLGTSFASLLLTREGCICVHVAYKLYHECKASWRHARTEFSYDFLLQRARELRRVLT